MIGLVIVGILILAVIILLQISKFSELASRIRGEEAVELESNNRTAMYLVVFMVLFLIFCIVSAYYYKDVMLGYGPHGSASAHGGEIDSLFNVTLFFTGIVFVLTQILLFWYAYKYRKQKNRKALFFPHNNTLELVWTVIPSIVLVYLVVKGLIVWNNVMPDVSPEDEFIEIEATGYQFAWDIRYPGADGQLGARDFKKIDLASNPLGQVWSDEKNIDDILLSGSDEIYLPKDKMVRVRITSKDVLHNFYLPHFRVKMDAIPGLPTYFIFTPIKSTQDYRDELSYYPEWQVPADPAEPDGPQRWETFNYELACAELCGKGHYSMRRILKVVSQEEYDQWLKGKSSYYLTNIRNTDNDPFKGQLLRSEIDSRTKELTSAMEKATTSTDAADLRIVLDHVFFNTGSAELRDISKYELDNLADLLNIHSQIKIELGGHTDNTGVAEDNQSLSQQRAEAVKKYLTDKGIDSARLSAKGYGQFDPIDTNDTEEGRQRNRRTELKITAQS